MYVFELCFQICSNFGVIEIMRNTHVLSELKCAKSDWIMAKCEIGFL